MVPLRSLTAKSTQPRSWLHERLQRTLSPKATPLVAHVPFVIAREWNAVEPAFELTLAFCFLENVGVSLEDFPGLLSLVLWITRRLHSTRKDAWGNVMIRYRKLMID